MAEDKKQRPNPVPEAAPHPRSKLREGYQIVVAPTREELEADIEVIRLDPAGMGGMLNIMGSPGVTFGLEEDGKPTWFQAVFFIRPNPAGLLIPQMRPGGDGRRPG